MPEAILYSPDHSLNSSLRSDKSGSLRISVPGIDLASEGNEIPCQFIAFCLILFPLVKTSFPLYHYYP